MDRKKSLALFLKKRFRQTRNEMMQDTVDEKQKIEFQTLKLHE
jgi:hypothetical protein